MGFELAKEETLNAVKTAVEGQKAGTIDDPSYTRHNITGIGQGRKVVAAPGTAEPLAASTPCQRVIIAAETDNTGVIAVGGSGVVAAVATRQGIPLSANDPPIALDIDDLADVFIDTTVAGDGVTYTYLT